MLMRCNPRDEHQSATCRARDVDAMTECAFCHCEQDAVHTVEGDPACLACREAWEAEASVCNKCGEYYHGDETICPDCEAEVQRLGAAEDDHWDNIRKYGREG